MFIVCTFLPKQIPCLCKLSWQINSILILILSGRFFLINKSISAFSHAILFRFSSITWPTAENRRSLSTLVGGADRYFRAAWASIGKRLLFILQYSNGLLSRERRHSATYPCSYKINDKEHVLFNTSTYSHLLLTTIAYYVGHRHILK